MVQELTTPREKALAHTADDRDYLAEAFRIAAGKSLMLAQDEHLKALRNSHYLLLEALKQIATYAAVYGHTGTTDKIAQIAEQAISAAEEGK